MKARILYVDFENKSIGLTIKPNLIIFEPHPFTVKIGDIFENAVVKRIDKNIGLAIELPTSDHQIAYVHVPQSSHSTVHCSNILHTLFSFHYPFFNPHL
jgi:hypothetical protein